MAEKDTKLNNDSINSRAVVERTNALKCRIEELEGQLAAHQVGLFSPFYVDFSPVFSPFGAVSILLDDGVSASLLLQAPET